MYFNRFSFRKIIFIFIRKTHFMYLHIISLRNLIWRSASLISALLISACLLSCGKCSCVDQSLVGIDLLNFDSSSTQSATVNEYVKDGTFTSLVNSSGSIRINNWGFVGELSYNFDYSYDYIVTVFPLGKVYKFKNLSHGSDSRSNAPNMGGECENCGNSISYNMNDSAYNIAEISFGHSNGGDGYSFQIHK